MEPANLKPFPDPDAELDALLRAPLAPLADDGFTARVVESLPPPRQSRTRFWFCIVGGLAGVGVAWIRGATWTSVEAGLVQLTNDAIELTRLASDPWVWCALTITAACLIFALRRDDVDALQ